MATIKSYTDLPQSKKLAEILPLESADMYYEKRSGIGGSDIVQFGNYADMRIAENMLGIETIPCWSLSVLLGVLPEIQGGKPVIALDDNYITYPHMSDLHTKADNLVDACVAMIEKLNEKNLL